MKLKKIVKNLTADDISQGTDITALKTTVGNNTSGLVKDTADLKTAVGDSSSGLVKDMTDAKAAIGADDTTAGGLKKRCKDIETAIGDEDTAASILGRIKALEDAAKTE